MFLLLLAPALNLITLCVLGLWEAAIGDVFDAEIIKSATAVVVVAFVCSTVGVVWGMRCA